MPRIRRTTAAILDWTHWHLDNARLVVGQVIREPGRERDLAVQSVKAAAAAVVAWVIAAELMRAPLSFIAPWVALLAATGAYVVVGDRTAAQDGAAIRPRPRPRLRPRPRRRRLAARPVGRHGWR